jgi:uncharacterized spore protein YtfJ
VLLIIERHVVLKLDVDQAGQILQTLHQAIETVVRKIMDTTLPLDLNITQ